MTQKNWTFLITIWLKKIEPLLNLFFKYDSKIWTFFLKYDSKELNPFFIEIWFKKNWIFFCIRNMTQKELYLFFLKYDSKRIESFFSRELNLFDLDMIQRIEPFVSITQSFSYMIQRFFLKKIKWLKELKFFTTYDSKNWLFFFWTYVQKLILFSMIHRIEPSLHDSKNCTLLLEYDAKNWTLFLEYDAKNWNLLLNKWLKELIHFSWIKELNLFSKNTTQRTELFFQHDSMILVNTTQRIDLFFWIR